MTPVTMDKTLMLQKELSGMLYPVHWLRGSVLTQM